MSKNVAKNLKGNDAIIPSHIMDAIKLDLNVDLYNPNKSAVYSDRLIPGEIVVIGGKEKTFLCINKDLKPVYLDGIVDVRYNEYMREATVMPKADSADKKQTVYHYKEAYLIRNSPEPESLGDKVYNAVKPVLKGAAVIGALSLPVITTFGAIANHEDFVKYVASLSRVHTEGPVDLTGNGTIDGANITLIEPATAINGSGLTTGSLHVDNGRINGTASEISITPYYDQNGNSMGEVRTFTNTSSESGVQFDGSIDSQGVFHGLIDGKEVTGRLSGTNISYQIAGHIVQDGYVSGQDALTDYGAYLTEILTPALFGAAGITYSVDQVGRVIADKKDKKKAEDTLTLVRSYLIYKMGENNLEQFKEQRVDIQDLKHLKETPAAVMDLVRNFEDNFEKLQKVTVGEWKSIHENIADYKLRVVNADLPKIANDTATEYNTVAPNVLALLYAIKTNADPMKVAIKKKKATGDTQLMNTIIEDIEKTYQSKFP